MTTLPIIRTWAALMAAARTGDVYVRWSRGPILDKRQQHSRDQVSGLYHQGLSCQLVHGDDPSLAARMIPEYQFLRRKDPRIYCWLLRGVINGHDTDGAPTVDSESIVPLGRVSDKIIAACTAYDRAYWQWARRGFREPDLVLSNYLAD